MDILPEYHKSRCQKCASGGKMPDIDWSWIDHVYCISLQDREDRAREAEVEFHKAGLCDKVIFYRPMKDTSDYKRPGTRGCWNSHHTVAKKAYDSGAQKVLIFEDDVEFDDNTTNAITVSQLAVFTRKIKRWNIIFLGQWSFLAFPTRYFRLQRVYSLAAHSYLLSGRALEWLAKTEYDDAIWLHKNKKFVGIGLDVFYMLIPRAYSIFPMLAYQRGAKSSNQRPNSIGRVVFDFALSDGIYMKYNQFISLALTTLLIATLIYILGVKLF